MNPKRIIACLVCIVAISVAITFVIKTDRREVIDASISVDTSVPETDIPETSISSVTAVETEASEPLVTTVTEEEITESETEASEESLPEEPEPVYDENATARISSRKTTANGIVFEATMEDAIADVVNV